MRSWLPWNLDRIFSLVAEGAASSPTWCEEQEPAMEPLHEEGNTGSVGREHGQGASGAWKPESENKTLCLGGARCPDSQPSVRMLPRPHAAPNEAAAQPGF